MEILLKAGLPKGEQLSLDKIDAEQMTHAIKVLTGQASANSMPISLSYDERNALHKLASERINGRFRKDAEGFAQELSRLAKQIEADQGNPDRVPVDGAAANGGFSNLLDEIFADRDRFRDEIA